MKFIRPTDVKMIALTTVGVMLAGYLMATFRSNSYVTKAIQGFDA